MGFTLFFSLFVGAFVGSSRADTPTSAPSSFVIQCRKNLATLVPRNATARKIVDETLLDLIPDETDLSLQAQALAKAERRPLELDDFFQAALIEATEFSLAMRRIAVDSQMKNYSFRLYSRLGEMRSQWLGGELRSLNDENAQRILRQIRQTYLRILYEYQAALEFGERLIPIFRATFRPHDFDRIDGLSINGYLKPASSGRGESVVDHEVMSLFVVVPSLMSVAKEQLTEPYGFLFEEWKRIEAFWISEKSRAPGSSLFVELYFPGGLTDEARGFLESMGIGVHSGR